MQDLPNEQQVQDLDADPSEASHSGKFNRELRLSKNNCPLCNFVQTEVEKGNAIPVEEWIYLAHLRNIHGIEP
jgi:hypothetical protein